MKRTTSPYILLKYSSIHGRGVFARKDIKKGTRVIEYVGKKITKTVAEKIADLHIEESKKDQTKGEVYLFDLNKRYDIDGNVSYNTARYINHSCDPNCETEIIRGKIWIIAIRDIKKGEELSYNYNYDFEDYQDHACRCGSINCVGFMLAEEYWPKLKKIQRQSKDKTNSLK